ncbi:hypothetical protein J5Y03_08145 [Bacillus sp. RG28]|uniref:Uncharacterized protein n=1 Tax=Gottfriedia endophytica TaxID=2820819 RepID=A0A940SGK3_9BACI|nr:hypothetical protein [Gottfriedia endophytica]MBP0725162.1 hypothetical protein [Gottfriedia endophytica]
MEKSLLFFAILMIVLMLIICNIVYQQFITKRIIAITKEWETRKEITQLSDFPSLRIKNHYERETWGKMFDLFLEEHHQIKSDLVDQWVQDCGLHKQLEKELSKKNSFQAWIDVVRFNITNLKENLQHQEKKLNENQEEYELWSTALSLLSKDDKEKVIMKVVQK